MVAAVNPDGIAAHYGYAGDGLRAYKKIADKITRFYYHNGNITLETDGTGRIAAQNVFSVRGIEARVADNLTLYHVKDAHGDVIGLWDERNNPLSSIAYDPYGNKLGTEIAAWNGSLMNAQRDEGVGSPFGFCGEYFDIETGLLFLRSRFMDPVSGRFTQEDPYWRMQILQEHDPQGLNLYVYCMNNPTNCIDPNGLDLIWICGSNMVNSGDFVGSVDRPLGHTSLLVEYKNDWYYFFYGKGSTQLTKITSPKALRSLSKLNKYLKISPERPYDSATYIQGDFSASFEFLQALSDSEPTAANYNFITNSCTTKSYEALMLGKLNNGTSIKDYAMAFNRPGGATLVQSDKVPNVDAAKIRTLFANTSFNKTNATYQINAEIEDMSKNAFSRWWNGFLIKQYKKLL